MEILKITTDDIKEEKRFKEGFESIIYTYKDGSLIKVYYDRKYFLKNTLKKIELFSQLSIPFVALPQKMVELSGEKVGYSMQKINGITLDVARRILTEEEIIKILKKLERILEDLHKHDIVVGDLNPQNILTDGEDVYLLDIVCSKIGNYNFSEKSKTMSVYLSYNKIVDKRMDNFMLNILTVYMLNRNLLYDNIVSVLEYVVDNYFTGHNKLDFKLVGIEDDLESLNVIFDMFSEQCKNELLLLTHLEKKNQANNIKK